MRISRKSLSVVAVFGAAALTLAGCSEPDVDDSAAHGGNDGAAEQSGDKTVITVYTSEPEEKVDQINQAFTEENPDVEVQVYRAGTGDLKARIDAEKSSGKVEGDLIWAADAPTFEEFKEQDLLSKFDAVTTDEVLEEVVDEDGYYVGTRLIPTVIAYNTDVIDQADAPKSWADLTDEKYMDKIVMPDPAVSGAAAFNATVWMNNEKLGETWVEDLGKNKPMIAASNGPTSQEIAGGGHPVGVVVDYLVRDLAAKGSPIKEVYATEGSPYITEPIGVFKDSEKKEAAQRYINFILSEKAQKLAVEQNYLPVLESVGTPGDAPKLDDIELMTVDQETLTNDRQRSVDFFQNSVK
ncbi:ABC transporter substrate-binding protein [uncultured Corynebacterium sp.]|uniref:ABC transporter substrate-binding protein n=1 Tax=uncultured Corynebacterium sp. TaxID=159447 RepID=UPI002619CBE7|nr:ABC transporter substrate-binding protein [uncultured Corynebacterium sp.]